MLVSILHRVLGTGVALVGLPLLVWWLAAAAAGEESYAWFMSWFTGEPWKYLGYLLLVGLSWSILQHMMTGIRHFVLDTGAGYELKRNNMGAMATMAASAGLTALLWAYLLGVK